MKKIVGIIAAVAMAASVFAADVSAKVKLDGSLFSYDGTNVSALMIQHNSDESWNPDLAFSVNSDNAGASFSYYIGTYGPNGGWNNGYYDAANSWQIWFKPFDMLKIVVGDYSTNLNQEHITWSKSASGCDSKGYALELYPMDGLSFAFALLPGWGENWFEGSATKELYAKFEYNADFGKINAMLDAANTFKTIKFGAGYANNFSGVNMFVNVLGFVNTGFEKLRVEAYADGNVDGFGWALWVPVDINLGDKVTANVGTIAKINYAIGAVNAYLYIEEADWLSFSTIEIKPGVTGSVGIMGWEVAADMIIGSGFTLNVPVTFTVNF